jgi:hypothetical protein
VSSQALFANLMLTRSASGLKIGITASAPEINEKQNTISKNLNQFDWVKIEAVKSNFYKQITFIVRTTQF